MLQAELAPRIASELLFSPFASRGPDVSFRCVFVFLVCLLLCSVAFAQSSCPVPTVNKTVNICSPVAGSTVSSPVQFTASALDNDHQITGVKLYVDNVEKGSSSYLANSVTFSASVALAAGAH